MQTTAPKARLSIACLLLGALLAAPLGCSSTQTRSGSKDGKSDPVAAYSARRQAEALEHIRKAEALEAAGKNDEAILEYRAALETKNDMFAAWNNLGELHAERGERDRSGRALEQADPDRLLDTLDDGADGCGRHVELTSSHGHRAGLGDPYE